MSYVVMVHTASAFKEYFLPALNDSDYILTLDKNIFDLKEDLEIVMEVIKNEWRFVKSDDYKVLGGEKQDYAGQGIKDGDVIYICTAQTDLSIVILNSVQTFQAFGKYDLTGMSEIRIGAKEENHIQYTLSRQVQGRTVEYVSGKHAVIQRESNGFVIYDSSKNGIYINSKRVQGSQRLEFGDCITIFGLKLIYLDTVLAVNQGYGRWKVRTQGLTEYRGFEEKLPNEQGGKAEKKYFKRSPRNLESLYTEKITIEAPPQVHKTKKKPLFMTIGPAFTMAIPMLLGSGMAILSSAMRGSSGGVYMFTGLVTAISSAAVGVFWALSNLKYEREQEVEEQQQLYNSYGTYLQERADFIKEKYLYNTEVLNNRYLSAQVYSGYDGTNAALWNRNLKHEDFLYTRLGMGNLPFQAEIDVPKIKFHMNHDELEEKPGILKQNYEMLYQVPIGIDLWKIGLVGLVGGKNRSGAIQVMHTMVTQIAVNNCYTDVKMVFIYQAESIYDEKEWAFAKWLPHVWSEDKKTRFVASNKNEVSDVCYELAKVFRTRDENAENQFDTVRPHPHYILFVQNLELLAGELITKYMLEPKPEYGLTTVLMEENYEDLPNACEDIIQNDGTQTSLYNVSESSSEKKVIQFDSVSAESLEELARRLSDIEVNASASSGEIPASLDFFEMYGVQDLDGLQVLERWTKNRNFDSMKALIGKKAGGADCYLDIHEKYHGPHGLVAGTTGSGKSETLQTYMLSLAVNFSPYDIGFFIIDFKGGGMANLFSNLPHLIGQISNLSGNQVRRAMISIKSENKRRQRVFTEHGVNNINLYTKLYKNGEAEVPVPHLFIIIDEFAELKREEPEFMKELISVAQVGRSLGVHLILATQKPSGTVDNNIWSNTKFRLCLRVQDRQDSNDMLHKPDAAYITQAGRGYLQVGNDELYELFQSGYSGAVYNPDSGNTSSIATMLTMTGKTAIVGNKNKRKILEKQKKQWMYTLYCQTVMLLNENKISFEHLLTDELMFEKFAEQLGKRLESQGCDYEMNPYNVARLKDFIEVCTQIPVKDPNVVDYILPQAQKMKRKLPELKEKTQLDAVVEYLGSVAKEHGYEQNLTLWLPVLPVMLGFERLQGFEAQCFHDGQWPDTGNKWGLNVMIGLCDDPENQQQEPLVIDFAENGHHAVCGMVVTGKSTFLQSLIYAMIMKYSPGYLNVYALDYSSRSLAVFEDDKHVGGVMYDTDVEKTARFFNMIEKMMDERKNLFKGANYSQYVQAHGVTLPAVLVAIDNFANFKEKTENRYESTLIRLSREGVGYGIFLAITSAGFGSAEIQTRIADNIRTVIALELGDKFKMADVLRTTRIEVMPEADVKGRGLAYVEGRLLEFQTAVALETEDDYKRANYIQKQCETMNAAWKKAGARRVPEIPEKPTLQQFEQLNEYEEAREDARRLPLGYYLSDASMCSIDLRFTYSYIISGKSRTGKTNLLKLLVCSAVAKQAEVCIIENSGSQLKRFAENLGVQYIADDKAMFDYFSASIPVFKERNLYKRQLLENGAQEDEIYEKMQKFKPIFIFIDSLPAFIQAVYRKQENGASMNGYLENITEKGFLHNIFFISGLNGDETAGCLGLKAYSNMIGYKTGIHLGGNLSAQRLFNFTNIPFAEQGKVTKPGTGLVPDAEENTIARTVVIPLVKGV